MDDINRYFEYVDKEDVIKKIVSLEFGKFLAYYADAPEIEKPTGRGDKKRRSAPATSASARTRPRQATADCSSTWARPTASIPAN